MKIDNINIKRNSENAKFHIAKQFQNHTLFVTEWFYKKGSSCVLPSRDRY